jgi:hypothetical protein
MTNPPEHPPRRKRDLDFDEWLAILVAFGVLGPILFWGLRPLGSNLALGDGQPFGGLTAPAPALSPNPGAIAANPVATPLAAATIAPAVPAIGANAGGPKGDGMSGMAVPLGVGLGGLAMGAAPSVAAPAAPLAPPAPIETPIPSPTVIPTTAAVPDGKPTPVLDASPEASATPVASPTASPTIVMAAPTAAPTIVASTFKDVPKGTWEAPFVTALGDKKLLSSFAKGEFKPDEPVTRSQFAAMLSQAMGFTADPAAAKAFQDLPAKYWATPMIGSAIKSGYMRGYSAKEFRPDQPIPRHQILIALVSGLKLKAPADVPGVMARYKDGKDVVKYAIDRVATATQASLVVNPTALDQLEPNRPATRGEAAAMIHQALVEQGKFKAIESSVVVKP